MSVLYEGPPYCTLMVLVIMSWICWIDNDTTEANFVICFSTCTVLDICGALSGEDATFRRWLSPWLDSPIFCTYASTLFMRKTIYISFSSIVLVSLEMARVIFANCSFMDIMSVAITGIVIKKREVKDLEWLE